MNQHAFGLVLSMSDSVGRPLVLPNATDPFRFTLRIPGADRQLVPECRAGLDSGGVRKLARGLYGRVAQGNDHVDRSIFRWRLLPAAAIRSPRRGRSDLSQRREADAHQVITSEKMEAP